MTAFVPAPSKRSTISSTVTIARARGEHRFLLHADDALDEHVAGAVGLLRVDDRDVGPMRRHARQRLAGERAGDELDVRVDRRRDPIRGSRGRTRTACPRRRPRRRAPSPSGCALRSRAAAASRARRRRAGGAASRRRDCRPTRTPACARSRCRSSGRRAGPASCGSSVRSREALPDDLVAGGERDEVREALERDTVARTARIARWRREGS